MKSAIEELIELMDKTYYPLNALTQQVFLEKEKQQVIDTYIDGQSHGFNNYKDGEDYYNKVFKDK